MPCTFGYAAGLGVGQLTAKGAAMPTVGSCICALAVFCGGSGIEENHPQSLTVCYGQAISPSHTHRLRRIPFAGRAILFALSRSRSNPLWCKASITVLRLPEGNDLTLFTGTRRHLFVIHTALQAAGVSASLFLRLSSDSISNTFFQDRERRLAAFRARWQNIRQPAGRAPSAPRP